MFQTGKIEDGEQILVNIADKNITDDEYTPIADANALLGKFYMQKSPYNNFTKAEVRLVRALAVNPESAIALYLAGKLLIIRDENYEHAKLYLQKAHALSPEDASILQDLALAKLYTNEFELGRLDLEKLKNLDDSVDKKVDFFYD